MAMKLVKADGLKILGDGSIKNRKKQVAQSIAPNLAHPQVKGFARIGLKRQPTR